MNASSPRIQREDGPWWLLDVPRKLMAEAGGDLGLLDDVYRQAQFQHIEKAFATSRNRPRASQNWPMASKMRVSPSLAEMETLYKMVAASTWMTGASSQ
jgi:hypothetical protein